MLTLPQNGGNRVSEDLKYKNFDDLNKPQRGIKGTKNKSVSFPRFSRKIGLAPTCKGSWEVGMGGIPCSLWLCQAKQ